MTDLFTKEQWFKLPMKLRQRWWAETDYGTLEPSPELKDAIEEAMRESSNGP